MGLDGECECEVTEVSATGSVNVFGDGDVEDYAQWSHDVNGTTPAAQDGDRGFQSNDGSANVTDKRSKTETKVTETGPSEHNPLECEVTAYVVSPLASGTWARCSCFGAD